MSSDETTVILKFVAYNAQGRSCVWEEYVDADDVESTVATIVATRSDIDRVEILAEPGDLDGEIIW